MIVLFLISEAVIGLEQTSYQLRQGADEVTVCVYISEPTPSQTRCPITFPFDLLFRLVEPSPGTVTAQFDVIVTICPFMHAHLANGSTM